MIFFSFVIIKENFKKMSYDFILHLNNPIEKEIDCLELIYGKDNDFLDETSEEVKDGNYKGCYVLEKNIDEEMTLRVIVQVYIDEEKEYKEGEELEDDEFDLRLEIIDNGEGVYTKTTAGSIRIEYQQSKEDYEWSLRGDELLEAEIDNYTEYNYTTKDTDILGLNPIEVNKKLRSGELEDKLHLETNY